MITDNFPKAKVDLDTERRRALAKVYSLLLRLAEKVDLQESCPDPAIEKSTAEPDSIPAERTIPP